MVKNSMLEVAWYVAAVFTTNTQHLFMRRKGMSLHLRLGTALALLLWLFPAALLQAPLCASSTCISVHLASASLIASSDGLSTPGLSDTQTSTSGVETGITETVSAPEEVPRTRPLSLYVAYEDLKPPSSPSPTPSGPKSVPPSSSPTEIASELTGGNDVAKTAPDKLVVGNSPSPNSIHYHSPYYMYEDLKPPTSPTPSPKRS